MSITTNTDVIRNAPQAISIISIIQVSKIKYVQSHKTGELEGAFLVGKVFLGPKGTVKTVTALVTAANVDACGSRTPHKNAHLAVLVSFLIDPLTY